MILRFRFCDIQIIKVSVSVINTYVDLYYSGYYKTSANNCFVADLNKKLRCHAVPVSSDLFLETVCLCNVDPNPFATSNSHYHLRLSLFDALLTTLTVQ